MEQTAKKEGGGEELPCRKNQVNGYQYPNRNPYQYKIRLCDEYPVYLGTFPTQSQNFRRFDIVLQYTPLLANINHLDRTPLEL